MSRQDRITHARENGLTGPSTRTVKTADEEQNKMEMLLMMNPAQRIAMGRKLGLI